MTVSKTVLVFNAGSSSLKFALYRTEAEFDVLLSGSAEGLSRDKSKFVVRNGSGDILVSTDDAIPDMEDAARRVIDAVQRSGFLMPAAIGHRIVHGGSRLLEHTVVDDAVILELRKASELAPLHVPAALSILLYCQSKLPGAPQVACLDTAFHARMPDVARLFPVTSELASKGIRRFGFHGLSCESIVRRLGTDTPPRLIIAHLGSGSSVTAVKDGQSVDTSMGLTPTGGMMMATRSGDLDPGLLLYLLRHGGYSLETLETLLEHGSGLMGVSALSGDLRELHEAADANESARLAIAMFCYSARKQIAAMAAALDGVDLLVFTGGIGENDPDVRVRICAGLAWIGGLSVRAIPAKEEDQIFMHTRRLAGLGQ
jgi:acetate kinase